MCGCHARHSAYRMSQHYSPRSKDIRIRTHSLFFSANNSGFLVDFISVPVTSAFTSATSIIIIGAQLKNLLGISYSSKGFADSIFELFIKIDESQFWDAMLGLGCCVFLLALRVSAIACQENSLY